MEGLVIVFRKHAVRRITALVNSEADRQHRFIVIERNQAPTVRHAPIRPLIIAQLAAVEFIGE